MPVTNPSVQEIILGLLPYLASLVITLSIAIFTFRRRSSIGAGSFSFMIFLEAFWTAGYIVSLVVPELKDKIFWDGIGRWCRLPHDRHAPANPASSPRTSSTSGLTVATVKSKRQPAAENSYD